MINIICAVRRPLPIRFASPGHDFIDGVLNMGGSGEGGGTGNDMAPWSSCMCCIYVTKWQLCIVVWRQYGLSLIYVLLCEDYMYCCIKLLYDLFWRLPMLGGSQNRGYIKTISSSVNRGIYGHVARAPGGPHYIPRLRVYSSVLYSSVASILNWGI
jgi:hypothetical protein